MDYKAFYFSCEGTVSRTEFWKFLVLPYLSVLLTLSVIDVVAGTFNETYQFGYFSLLFFFLTLYSAIVISIKRLRERNRSGWILLLLPVVLLHLWPLIELLFLPAKKES